MQTLTGRVLIHTLDLGCSNSRSTLPVRLALMPKYNTGLESGVLIGTVIKDAYSKSNSNKIIYRKYKNTC